MSMNEEQYLAARLNDQIAWYERKSVVACRWFKSLRTLELFAAATIPFVSGYTSTYPQLTLAIGALGVMVAVIAGLLSLNQFQERWVEYRTTCEELKRERFLYLTKSSIYTGDNALALLAQRVEELLAKEHSNWSQYMRSIGRTSNRPEHNTGPAIDPATSVAASPPEATARVPVESDPLMDGATTPVHG